jgi:DNA-binding transcriptional ArsR family regulator
MKRDFYQFHADVCKSIVHPKRLEILDHLRETERSVNELARLMEIPAANVSQHLAILRNSGVVQKRVEGTTSFYRLTDRRVVEAFDLMSKVMEEYLATRTQAVEEKKLESGT